MNLKRKKEKIEYNTIFVQKYECYGYTSEKVTKYEEELQKRDYFCV